MTEDTKSNEIQTLIGLSSNSTGSVTREKSIEASALPELGQDWIQQAIRSNQFPEKKQISFRIDEDILEFFRQQGSRYQTRMHMVLRAYVDDCRKTNV